MFRTDNDVVSHMMGDHLTSSISATMTPIASTSTALQCMECGIIFSYQITPKAHKEKGHRVIDPINEEVDNQEVPSSSNSW